VAEKVNRVLGKIFGPKRVEVTGDWRNLHSEELHDLYSIPSIIQVMKLRRTRWHGVWHIWGRGGFIQDFGEET
jgi:hypothetical protein